jgi:hypothetical protein
MPNLFTLHRCAASLLAGLLAACATAPEAVVTYYPARAESTITVTQTIACDKDKSFVLLAHAVAIDTVYASDYAHPQQLRLAAIGGAFATNELAFKFSDDGRLKSINASTAGQGEAVVKALSSLTALALARFEARADAPGPSPCLAIARWGGDKPLTLVYTRRLAHADEDGDALLTVPPDPDSLRLYQQLQALAIGLPVLTLRTTVTPVRPAAIDSAVSGEERLALKGTASVRLALFANGVPVGGAEVTVPHAPFYALPLPRSGLFGKQSLSLTLSDAGAVTSLSYGGDGGGAGLVNAASVAAQAMAPPSTAEQASALKAQADLIHQQQRLSLCRLAPADCR